MSIFRGVGLLLVLLALGDPARAQPVEASPPALAALEGEWRAVYVDRILGLVEGTAHIDATHRKAEVAYRHRVSGREYRMTSSSFDLSGDTLTIILEGQSPVAAREDGTGRPNFALVLDRPAPQITVNWGTNQASLPVVPLAETDRDRVTLVFKVKPHVLAGSWRYRTHWFIQRAADGRGRAGDQELLDGVNYTIGGESWERPRPFVYGAFPLEDQLAFRLNTDGTAAIEFPYPLIARGGPLGKTRTLFVFGKDLPRDYRRPFRVEGLGSGIDYTVIARQSDAAGSDYYARTFAEGRRKLAEHLPSAPVAELDKLDAVIVRAEIREDATPGFQSFKAEGQEVGWMLQFGDNTATLRVVRRTRNAFEPTAHVFPSELVRIEVEAAHRLSVETIPIIVGVDGAPHLIGYGEGIAARRDPDHPRIYRTDYIYLAAEGPAASTPGMYVMPGKVGSRIQASIGRPGIISIPPPSAQATIFEDPADAAVGGSWDKWLQEAATCAGLVGSGVALERSEAETITEWMIGNVAARTLTGPSVAASRKPLPLWLDTKVSVGQHSAMLLLRDTFVRQLRHVRSQFARIRSDEEILAFRRHFEPLVRQAATPLSRVEVPSLDPGGKTDFIWTFEQSILARLQDRTIDEVERWAISATRVALDAYITAIDGALAKAEAIDTCEVEKLLRLTGNGFGSVATIAKSKLVSRPTSGGFWTPDFRPRAFVDTVAILGEQLAIQDKVGREDTRDALAAVGLATLPLAIIGGAVGSVGAVFATFIIDVIDVFWGAYSELDAKWTEDAEVRFAMGAADVLGINRLRRAEAARRTWSKVFVDLGFVVAPAATGIVFDIPELFKAFRQVTTFARTLRGRTLVATISDRANAAAPNAASRPDLDAMLDAAAAPAADVAAAREVARRRLGETVADLEREAQRRASRAADAKPPATDAKPRTADTPVTDLPPASTFTHEAAGRSGDELAGLQSALDDIPLGALDVPPPDIRRFYPDGMLPGQANFKPESLAFVRHHALYRADVRALLEAAPARVAVLLDAAGEVGRRAREVIAFEHLGLLARDGGNMIDALEARVAYLAKRTATPQGAARYAEAREPEVMRALARHGWHARKKARATGPERGLPIRHPDGSLRLALHIRAPDGRLGLLSRSYEKQVFTMSMAFREAPDIADVPWVTRASRSPTGKRLVQPTPAGEIPGRIEIPGRGSRPTMPFFNSKVMHFLGIPYASPDGMKRAVMSTISNLDTILQVNWFRRTYFPEATSWSEMPPREFGEFLQRTFSGRYGAEAVAIAGYRVTGARMARPLGDIFVAGFRNDFKGTDAEFVAMLRTYGFQESDRVSAGFDIVFDVAPWSP